MNHKHSKNVITRLSKIEGHVKAIKKMVEEGRSCDEILLQFSAVESALKKAGKIIVSDHFENCIMSKVENEELKEELEEFQKVFEKYYK